MTTHPPAEMPDKPEKKPFTKTVALVGVACLIFMAGKAWTGSAAGSAEPVPTAPYSSSDTTDGGR